MPKVSVILPAYNVEKYIAKSIQSVLNQDFEDFELLIVIDGSPDHSKRQAEAFSDSRIKIFEKQNGGLSDARNYGLERATGEFVYFMDSDDWIEPNLLKETITILQNENLDFVVFGYTQDNEDAAGKVESAEDKIPKINSLKRNAQHNIDIETLGILGYAWNKVYRRSFLNDNKLRFEKGVSLVEDILFNALVYQKTNEIRLIQQSFYHYINRDVPTLIKQFHKNSFDLNLWKIKRLSEFFSYYGIVNSENILSAALVQGIRYCVHNLFSFKNNLTFVEKRNYVKYMLNNPETRRLIKNYIPEDKSSLLYKLLIKNKNYNLISIFALAIK